MFKGKKSKKKNKDLEINKMIIPDLYQISLENTDLVKNSDSYKKVIHELNDRLTDLGLDTFEQSKPFLTLIGTDELMLLLSDSNSSLKGAQLIEYDYPQVTKKSKKEPVKEIVGKYELEDLRLDAKVMHLPQIIVSSIFNLQDDTAGYDQKLLYSKQIVEEYSKLYSDPFEQIAHVVPNKSVNWPKESDYAKTVGVGNRIEIVGNIGDFAPVVEAPLIIPEPTVKNDVEPSKDVDTNNDLDTENANTGMKSKFEFIGMEPDVNNSETFKSADQAKSDNSLDDKLAFKVEDFDFKSDFEEYWQKSGKQSNADYDENYVEAELDKQKDILNQYLRSKKHEADESGKIKIIEFVNSVNPVAEELSKPKKMDEIEDSIRKDINAENEQWVMDEQDARLTEINIQYEAELVEMEERHNIERKNIETKYNHKKSAVPKELAIESDKRFDEMFDKQLKEANKKLEETTEKRFIDYKNATKADLNRMALEIKNKSNSYLNSLKEVQKQQIENKKLEIIAVHNQAVKLHAEQIVAENVVVDNEQLNKHRQNVSEMLKEQNELNKKSSEEAIEWKAKYETLVSNPQFIPGFNAMNMMQLPNNGMQMMVPGQPVPVQKQEATTTDKNETGEKHVSSLSRMKPWILPFSVAALLLGVNVFYQNQLNAKLDDSEKKESTKRVQAAEKSNEIKLSSSKKTDSSNQTTSTDSTNVSSTTNNKTDFTGLDIDVVAGSLKTYYTNYVSTGNLNLQSENRTLEVGKLLMKNGDWVGVNNLILANQGHNTKLLQARFGEE